MKEILIVQCVERKGSKHCTIAGKKSGTLTSLS
jgi:hypothetical protein